MCVCAILHSFLNVGVHHTRILFNVCVCEHEHTQLQMHTIRKGKKMQIFDQLTAALICEPAARQ